MERRVEKATNSLSSEYTEQILRMLQADHLSVALLLTDRQSAYSTHHTAAALLKFVLKSREMGQGVRVCVCVCACHKTALFKTQIKAVLQNPHLILYSLKWKPPIQLWHNACSLKKEGK